MRRLSSFGRDREGLILRLPVECVRISADTIVKAMHRQVGGVRRLRVAAGYGLAELRHRR